MVDMGSDIMYVTFVADMVASATQLVTLVGNTVGDTY